MDGHCRKNVQMHKRKCKKSRSDFDQIQRRYTVMLNKPILSLSFFQNKEISSN